MSSKDKESLPSVLQLGRLSFGIEIHLNYRDFFVEDLIKSFLNKGISKTERCLS